MINQVLDFMDKCPTAYQAVANMKTVLDKCGYIGLKESEAYDIKRGNKYYISRNDSSLLIFNVGKDIDDAIFKIVSSHSDSPTFKIKPKPLIKDGKYVRLNTEIYGGPILSSWVDKPLSIAGRLITLEDDKIKSIPFDLKEDFCIIASLAIHQNRKANEGFVNNPQIDLLPLVSLDQEFDFIEFLKSKSGLDNILSFDLYLYPRIKSVVYSNGELFSTSRIDNLLAAVLSFLSVTNTFDDKAINMAAIFNNEEVGSCTYQGADSDFLESNLKRITKALDLDFEVGKAKSFVLSVDAAHAIHPSHPEKSDPENHPLINKGLTIKFNAMERYTTDAMSFALYIDLLKRHNVEYQVFANRSDERGGGTLGNISNRHVSMRTIDLGIPQLSMHSSFETAGVKDVTNLYDGMHYFYSDSLKEIL